MTDNDDDRSMDRWMDLQRMDDSHAKVVGQEEARRTRMTAETDGPQKMSD